MRQVWVYLKEHSKPLPHRPLKIMPKTQDWLDHLNDLADAKPTDPITYLEFRPGLAIEPDEYEEQLVSEIKGTISVPGLNDDLGETQPSKGSLLHQLLEAFLHQ